MNRTQSAVEKQLRGFDCHRYELGIRGADGRMLPREWDSDTVRRSLGWLRLMNRQSHDIYIRPWGSSGFVLLDDLEDGALRLMSRDGFCPALIVQTSPSNFQAWVRLLKNEQNKPISTHLLTAAAQELAKRYHGDPNSADWRHFGRMVGFTNRKPPHFRNGMFPYVLLCEATGVVAPKGRDLLVALQSRPAPAPSALLRAPSVDLQAKPGDYAVRFQALCINLNLRSADLSRADFMIARDMAREGYSAETIRRILTESPNLSTRKRGHLNDYLDRTVTVAFKG